MRYKNISDKARDIPVGYEFVVDRESQNSLFFKDKAGASRCRDRRHYEPLGQQEELVFTLPMLPPPPARLSVEKDPTGLDPHTPGAKLDAGKAGYDMALFSFPLALAAVNAVGEFGARKYTPGGFLKVENGEKRYLNADLRHKAKTLQGEEVDAESGELHDAHAAWCALAKLELKLRGKA